MTDRTEWLAWRRQGIGASDVAGILGVSPWTSPYGVWCTKVMDVAELDGEHLLWGHLLEDAICSEAARRLDVTVTSMQTMVCHPDHPHHLATIDALTSGPIIEAKVTGDREPWTEVPLHYYVQALWQMHVTGQTEAEVAVLHAGQHLELLPVERHDADIAVAVAAVEAFWHDHVLPGIPPPVTAIDVPALNRTPGERGKELVASPDIESLFRQWEAADAAATEAQEYALTLRARLSAAMGPATDLVASDGRLLVTWRPTREFDTAAVEAAHPDVVAKHTTPVPTVDWTAVKKTLGKKTTDTYMTPTGTRRWLPKETNPR